MKLILKYLKPFAAIAFLGIVFVASDAFIQLYQIQLMGSIIDVGIANADMDLILKVGFQMVGFALLGIVVSIFGLVIPTTVTTHVAHNMRSDLYKKIQSFSIKNMNRFQTATLITRLTNDIDFLQRTLLMTLRMLVRAPVLLISTIIFTFRANKTLAQIPFVAVFLLALLFTVIIYMGFPRFVTLQEKLDNLSRKIQESLINVRVIKSFVREDMEDEQFRGVNQDFYNTSMRAHTLMLLIDPALMAAINFASIGIMYMATHLIIDVNVISIGDLLVFINYLRFTMFSMMMITQVFMMMTRSKASIQRVNEIFNTKVDIASKEGAYVNMDPRGSVVFDAVSFKYFEDASYALKDINLTINPGDKIGVIGSTGSGKSTLINLLGRLIDVSEGSIYVDGVDVLDYDVSNLRSIFGFVPQKNVLFKGTIESNLKLGNEEASHEVLRQATKAASIYDFIADSDLGFASEVQQGGLNFSGGQRQRLCIARALVMNPKVLILDDSTSALDAATESKVMEALGSQFEGMTLINIAQKISSVSKMDKIVVLNEGELVGIGDHDSLLKSCGVYQEIYKSQMREESGVLA